MHKYKHALPALGLLFALIALAPAAYGQKAQPTPTPGPTAVNVVNTPAVTLAPGAAVGIDPANNTVKLDAASPLMVREEETVLVFDETTSLGLLDDAHVGPVDVSAFKQIRVVASVGGTVGTTVHPRILLNGSLSGPVVPLDSFASIVNSSSGYGTKVYDLPGRTIDFYVHNPVAAPSTVRIQVYGRR